MSGSSLAIGLIIALPAIGVGLGQGRINKAALAALNQQPAAYTAINRLTLIAMALNETTALVSVLTALLIFISPSNAPFSFLGTLGIACSIAIPGFAIGLASALPAREALNATARQPFFAQRIMTLLFITQPFIQTPIIFGLITSFLLRAQLPLATTLNEGLRLFASGFVLGIGSLGPIIGLAYFGQAACKSSGINRAAYTRIRTFTFLSQALIEAPIVFALLIALLLATIRTPPDSSLLTGIALLSAAFALSFSTLATGIASGRTGAVTCLQIGKNPEIYGELSRLAIPAQTLIDTCAIYGLVVSLFLIILR